MQNETVTVNFFFCGTARPKLNTNKEIKYMLDRIALILSIIGAVNWGSIGLFQFDLVAWLFGGQDNIISRIIYALVGLAGVWCISLLFRERNIITDGEEKI